VKALSIAMGMEVNLAPSMRANAKRWVEEPTTAMFIGTPRVRDASSQARMASCAAERVSVGIDVVAVGLSEAILCDSIEKPKLCRGGSCVDISDRVVQRKG